MCPQEILAHKRKERENGHTIVPTSSKKDIKRAKNWKSLSPSIALGQK